MLDKGMNLYLSSVPYYNATAITVFDDYVAGEMQQFKITNLDATLVIKQILVDGVNLPLTDESIFYNDGTWVFETGYVHTSDAGANMVLYFDCTNTAKKITIKAGSHNSAHFARIQQMPYNLTVGGAITAGYGNITALSGNIVATGNVSATGTISATGNVSSGNAFIGKSIELVGPTPFIDFKTSSGEDYDMRVIMASTADKLQVGKIGVAYGQGKLEHTV